MNSSNYVEKRKRTFSKQKQTRVNGALGTVYAYRVIFENGEPARNPHLLEKDYHGGIS